MAGFIDDKKNAKNIKGHTYLKNEEKNEGIYDYFSRKQKKTGEKKFF